MAGQREIRRIRSSANSPQPAAASHVHPLLVSEQHSLLSLHHCSPAHHSVPSLLQRSHYPPLPLPHPLPSPAAMSSDKTSELLADVSIDALIGEVTRRMDCTRKPDKRLILIGPPGTTRTCTQSRSRVQYKMCATHLGWMRGVVRVAVCRLWEGHSGPSSQARELPLPLGHWRYATRRRVCWH